MSEINNVVNKLGGKASVATIAALGAAYVADNNKAFAATANIPINTPLVNSTGLSTSMEEHVARRFSLTATPTLFNQVKAVGWKQWMTDQLNMNDDADNVVKNCITSILPYTLMSHYDATQAITKAGLSWGGVDQHALNLSKIGTTVVYSLMTPRHVHEAMVQFWLDFFSVPYDEKGEIMITDLDLEMRRVALTSFPNIFKRVYAFPKIWYELDNNQNIAGGINENLARETLELYSIGVDNFAETDMEKLAILFSGWASTNVWETPNGQPQMVLSQPHAYTTTPLTILGVQYPNSNKDEATKSLYTFFDNLTKMKLAADYVSKKLCLHFVSDNAPQSLIDKVSATYQSTNGDVKSMLWTILNSNEFASSAGQKWKRPIEYLGSAHRAREPKWIATSDVRNHAWYYWYSYIPMTSYRAVLASAGNEPRKWLGPNGYPDISSYWQGSATMLYPMNKVINTLGEDEELQQTKTWVDVLGLSESNTTSTNANKIIRGLTGYSPNATILSSVTAELNNTSVPFNTRVENAVRLTYTTPLAWLR